MTEEDYVSFEIAKLLKEKGFDEPCFYVYRHDGSEDIWDADKEDIACQKPTLQMAMKWLREVYDLQIIFIPVRTKQHKNWTFEIYKEFIPLYTDVSCFSTYEEACEAAIKYCLENLI